jgi:hypothetical protein
MPHYPPELIAIFQITFQISLFELKIATKYFDKGIKPKSSVSIIVTSPTR